MSDDTNLQDIPMDEDHPDPPPTELGFHLHEDCPAHQHTSDCPCTKVKNESTEFRLALLARSSDRILALHSLWRYLCTSCTLMDQRKKYFDIFIEGVAPQDHADLAFDLELVLDSKDPSHLEHFRRISRYRYETPLMPSSSQLPVTQSLEGDLFHPTQLSFTQEYQGKYHEVFLRTLDDYYLSARNENTASEEVYSLTTSMIQSSMTGKSRLTHSAARIRFSFPFTLREDLGMGQVAWPPPDIAIRDHITGDNARDAAQDVDALCSYYHRFLLHMFKQTLLEFESKEFVAHSRDFALERLPEVWYNWLKIPQRRKSFLARVVESATDDRSELDFSEGKKCAHAAAELVQTIRKHRAIEEQGVEILLVFDEAHTLASLQTKQGQRSGLLCMERALQCLKPLPIFTVFLSTNSSLEELATPSARHPSFRTGTSYKLYPPLTEFTPFDLFYPEAYGRVFKDGVTLEGMSNPSLVLSYGRPHWYSLYQNLHLPSPVKLEKILHLARQKLQPKGFSASDENSVAACVSLRYLLTSDINYPQGRMMQSELVKSYMQVVRSIPSHRMFMQVDAPSEPVLAETAAVILHEGKHDIPEILRTLLSRGLLAKGERGELVMRYLLINAHDAAALEEGPTKSGLRYHRPVRFLSLLKHLLVEEVYSKILEAKSVLDKQNTGDTLEIAMKDVWVHFSHFSQAGDSEILQLHNSRHLFLRGTALQCKPTQEGIDCIAVLCKTDDPKASLSLKNFGASQWQAKERDRTSRAPIVSTRFVKRSPASGDCPIFTGWFELSANNTSAPSTLYSICHGSPPKTCGNQDDYDPHTNHFQITFNSLWAFKLSESDRIRLSDVLNLNKAAEEFPRLSFQDNYELMREKRPDFRKEKGFPQTDWI